MDQSPVHSELRALLIRALAEADRSHNAIRTALQKALDKERTPEGPYCFIADIFEDDLIVGEGSSFHRRSFEMNDDGTATLGAEKVEVMPETIYHDVDADAMREAAVTIQEVKGVKLVIGFKRGGGSETQSVIFDREAWTKERAREWLKEHSLHAGKLDETEDSYRFRQADPKKFMRFRTIAPGMAKRKEAAEPIEVTGDYIELVESGIRADGTIPVKLIAPGKGAMAFYPAEVLQRDGPKIFRKGLEMFIDHPTKTEESTRPEGSLRALGARLASDARFIADHPKGSGLFAEAKIAPEFRPFVETFGEDIGLSIRAWGKGKSGTLNGQPLDVPILESLDGAHSVDFVTRAGAGGKVLQLFESARSGQIPREEFEMTEQEATALKEANRTLQEQLCGIQHQMLLREGADIIREKLSQAKGLAEASREVLLPRLIARIPVKAGALDVPALVALIEAEVTAEAAYLARLAGTGQVTGMGSVSPVELGAFPKPEEVTAQLRESFKLMGMSEKASEVAATARRRIN